MARPTVRTISRYLLRQHVAPLGFALTALTSLMLLNQIAKQFGSLVGKGLPWSVILEVFVLSIPFIIAVTLPMAVLVAVLHVFTHLAGDNEITAMQASGVSVGRVIRPVLAGAAVVALLSFLWNDQVLPRSNHRLRTLQVDIQAVNRTDPTELDRTFFRVNRMRVAGVGNTLERTENDTYKSDREMSICEMRGVVAQARHEAERARQDTRAAVQNDLRRLAGLAPVYPPPLYPPPAAYGVDTAPVGLYCRALRRVTAWLVPTPAVAQTPSPTPRRPRPAARPRVTATPVAPPPPPPPAHRSTPGMPAPAPAPAAHMPPTSPVTVGATAGEETRLR